ncbi:related to phenol 2-monooxygenase [Ramularia collo-cygni]|uniref:Related to phenol 2-monooxygenase n=1 Tax=Ramularia collo-cygni TaxID=112498 RepID=A0A2D3V639_9PEZI|nr:related to phenol 2-monooxygenase [Ramularia collo-cygni]CZT22165.1 related to phenol 2-monooxygenase [Ramularia collo-cygni]
MAESTTDVVIVGAGPAGMMASMYFAEMGIPFRIIDKRGTRTLNGRADGFHTRTLEIWESFGIADKARKHGVPLGQFSMWNPDPNNEDGGIVRNRDLARGVGQTNVVMEEQAGTNEKPWAIHQGFIEAAMIEATRVRGGARVERGTVPESILLDTDLSAEYPVLVKVRHMLKSEVASPRTGAHSIAEDGSLKPERGFIDAFGGDPHEISSSVGGKEGSVETIRAKYVIGADGAHSWVRRSLGLSMEGETTDAIWGAIDIKPLTNFPDVRKVTNIFSRHGSALLIPRELGLVRVYVQLPDDYILRKGYEPEEGVSDIMSTARKILAPYTMDYKYCDWFTIYAVAQRMCKTYSVSNRIFLAGDAVHTHSPKGGQGQNVSQQDTYNLAFKIAAVLRNQMSPSILSTYQTERLPVAYELIELDQIQGKIMDSRKEPSANDIKLMVDRLLKQNGTGVMYSPNALIAGPEQTNQEAAKKLKLGMRVPNTSVFNQSNGVATNVQSLLESTGSWRILVFAGDVTKAEQLERINNLNEDLDVLIHKYPSASTRQPEKFAEILTFHSANINDVDSKVFHSAFFPHDAVDGYNYDTIFGDFTDLAEECTGGAYRAYDVDLEQGALVLVRPDQVVAWVGYLRDLSVMRDWLATFMISKDVKLNGVLKENGVQDGSQNGLPNDLQHGVHA